MGLTETDIQEFKVMFERDYGHKFSDEEAWEAATNLYNYVKHLYKWAQELHALEERLKIEPKGFHLNGGAYSCCICGAQVCDKETWYDTNGLKCLLCQSALEKQIIPASACKDEDSWYSVRDLRRYYNVHPSTAKKLAKQGKLKAKIIPDEMGKPHFYVFLISDNPALQNPKPESQLSDGTFYPEPPEPMKLRL